MDTSATSAAASSVDAPPETMVYLQWAGIAVLIIVLYFAINSILTNYRNTNKNEPMLIPTPTNIQSLTKSFDGNLMPMSKDGTEYAYSFWIMINDWNFNYGKPKCIMFRSTDDVNSFKVASPSIWLYPRENKLMVRVSTQNADQRYDQQLYPNASASCRYDGDVRGKNLNTPATACDISNIPLQKWVHISVSLWNRLLDVYMNGKLVRSCVLPGVPVTDPNQLKYLYVGKGDTYNGYISRLKYFNRALSANEVYDLYAAGPLPASFWWTELVDKIQISFNIHE